MAESTEMTTKLGELKIKLGEYESTIRDHTSAISSAKSKCDEWTRSDVGKIQRESFFPLCLFSPSSLYPRCKIASGDQRAVQVRAWRSKDNMDQDQELTNRRIRNSARSSSMEDPIHTCRPTRDALCLGIEVDIQLLSLHTRPRNRFHLLLGLQRRRRRGYRGITGASEEQPWLDVEIEI